MIKKFSYIVPQIGAGHKDNRFAIIIDEARSGQSGRNSAQVNLVLSGLASDDDMDNEDKVNAMMEGRKLLNNASYFVFTATTKNKTLKTFGVPYQDGDDIKHRQKSQRGVFVKFFVNDIDKQSDFDKVLRYKGRFLKIYNYRQEDDKIAALHAKVISVD